MIAVQLLVVAAFVLVHLFGGGLRFLDVIPRSRWLSFAGGISVAYVFVHVLPELAEIQENLSEANAALAWMSHHAYLAALFGLGVFYGLERLVKTARPDRSGGGDEEAGKEPAADGVFWVHVGSFALYNGLIGYLLVHREEPDLRGLLFFSVAMLLHFLVNDFGLRQDHRAVYHRRGRWVLAASIVAGWVMGLASEVSETALGVLFSFLAGGVILNILKEELPEERQSRFGAFAMGVLGYTGLLLLL